LTLKRKRIDHRTGAPIELVVENSRPTRRWF